MHPLEKLLVGDKPDIGLGSQALNEANNTILVGSGIRQTNIVGQMGRVNINTERLAVTVVMTIKVSLRPSSHISRRTGKVHIHKLRNTGIV